MPGASCCLQELIVVLTKALFLPCLELTEPEQAGSAELVPHGPFLKMDTHWLRWKLLHNITRLVKTRETGLWIWQRVMPHCCDWLRAYVSWATDPATQHELRLEPYLTLFGKSSAKCGPNCLRQHCSGTTCTPYGRLLVLSMVRWSPSTVKLTDDVLC